MEKESNQLHAIGNSLFNELPIRIIFMAFLDILNNEWRFAIMYTDNTRRSLGGSI